MSRRFLSASRPTGRGGPLMLWVALLGLALTSAAQAQPEAAGLQYLRATQRPDGAWQSPVVRESEATAAVLFAFQRLAPGEVAVRASASGFLRATTAADSDDLGHRLAALRGELDDVTPLATQLAAAANERGGWGLAADFAAEPLATALALQALAGRVEASDLLIGRALARLLVLRAADGGFPAVTASSSENEGDIFATSRVLAALLPYRQRFQLDDEVAQTVAFLVARRNINGSFGPPGPLQLPATALAATSLAAVPAIGAEVSTIRAYLLGEQGADGSWRGDGWTTALVLAALDALSTVPFCGDGLVNLPWEACDTTVPAALSCEGLGLGAGTLACSSRCTLDTSACAAAPICGDGVRNQLFEVCDSGDLGGETCVSQGFSAGSLACDASCGAFETSSCTLVPACGDGRINQPSEECDFPDLGGLSCDELGLGTGLLGCSASCELDIAACDAPATVIESKGKEFLFGFLPTPINTLVSYFLVTSEVPTTVRVEQPVNSPFLPYTETVTPGVAKRLSLRSNANSDWVSGVPRNNAVRLLAEHDISVTAINQIFFGGGNDASVALPVDALGSEYLVTTLPGSTIVPQDRAQFLVIATVDDTTVTITPKAAIRLPPPSVPAPAGVPFTVTLDRGFGLLAQAFEQGADLTGSRVVSNQPVQVLSGNICANLPVDVRFCDPIFEVALPLHLWGTSAFAAGLPLRLGGSYYRVLAATDNTEVSLDGVPQGTLDATDFLEIGPLPGDHQFTANRPILVTQLMTGTQSPGATLGDPSMVTLLPPELYLESYTLPTGTPGYLNHFALVAPSSAIGDLRLDGAVVPAASFTPIGSTGFSAARLPVSDGTHRTSSTEPHGLVAVGYAEDDSYLFSGGFRQVTLHPFCGDELANRAEEQCDGVDLRGESCSSLGFTSGALRCAADCTYDLSSCGGLGDEDADDDGFPALDDCDDGNAQVNPGQVEIPGNGVDDDCNPGTPDSVPAGSASCRLLPSALIYQTTDRVELVGEVTNTSSAFTLTSLALGLEVRNTTGSLVFVESRTLATLPAGARSAESYGFHALGLAPGEYNAQWKVASGVSSLTQCAASFTIESSSTSGAGLEGSLVLVPAEVTVGETSTAELLVTNEGNSELAAVQVVLLVVHPDTGQVVASSRETVSLPAGGVFATSRAIETAGLEPRLYLVVLSAELAEAGLTTTLASAPLTVSANGNLPPSCAQVKASPARLWPPNHDFVDIEIVGVTDPEGEAVTIEISSIRQDEPVLGPGSGNTCPDAYGVGDRAAKLRAERRGGGDGRVYHISFTAEDGQGGVCAGEVEVCVPKSRGGSNAHCVDQGPLFDSTVCP